MLKRNDGVVDSKCRDEPDYKTGIFCLSAIHLELMRKGKN